MAERDLPDVVLDLLETLTRQEVRFVIIGGVALALHGIPRSTLDVDIAVPSRAPILRKLLRTVRQSGLTNKDKDIEPLFEKPQLLVGQWMIFLDDAGREVLDVYIESPDAFEGLLSRACREKGHRLACAVASLDDIERMKRISGRPLDLADIALIREARRFRTEQKRGAGTKGGRKPCRE